MDSGDFFEEKGRGVRIREIATLPLMAPEKTPDLKSRGQEDVSCELKRGGYPRCPISVTSDDIVMTSAQGSRRRCSPCDQFSDVWPRLL
jgi:hypothetical protein